MPFTYHHLETDDLDLVRGETLSMTVRRRGAEVIGLTHHQPGAEDLGLLWRNARLDDPPRFWTSHATILFPIVGRIQNLRSRTTDGIDVWFKKLHGFVRLSRLQLLGHGGDAECYNLHYLLLANEETLAGYPWRFEFWVHYALHRDRLIQTIEVKNRDEKPLPFQLGWHPGINTPLRGGRKADCHLRLPAGPLRRMLNDDKCQLTGESRLETYPGDFPFTEEELDGTYMFDLSDTAPEKRIVELLDPDEKFGVRVRFPDYPHLGVWSDAKAPFICIEPWQGMDDSAVQEPFDQKFGMLLLPPGEQRTFQASLEIIEK